MASRATSSRLHQAPEIGQVQINNTIAAEQSRILDNEASTIEVPVLQIPQTRSQFQTQPDQYFYLTIHEDSLSKEDVLLNLPPAFHIHQGDILQISSTTGNDNSRTHNHEEKGVDPHHSLYCLYQPVAQDVLCKLPKFQISVSRRISDTFGFEKGIGVRLSKPDESDSHASHVEIVFRDQYLARADMWRLILSELRGTCIHRGQRIEFLGSIRAQIKNIFKQGRKAQSAFFGSSAKPIFRSESARYVLFIQMSKEMWDFDAEGSGEIMFDKVINGFLPELFKRWHEVKVKHLVSIVLFTKMIYEEHIGADVNILDAKPNLEREPGVACQRPSKDFYRVVVSDMASGEWAMILNQLKKEFKVFLRDISIRIPYIGDHLPLGEGLSSALTDTPSYVIAGHPSTAIQGNLLEAINLASSQFASDYIDRDLVRTGVSIMIITPGAGVFEVDYNLLVATSENLIDNGVGIDLVCLSRMPLHSVPLFKYDPPPDALENAFTTKLGTSRENEDTPTGSVSGEPGSGTPPSSLMLTSGSSGTMLRDKSKYGIPHWIDVSFWTSSSSEAASRIDTSTKVKDKSILGIPLHKTFTSRVKMYEIQMMGVMENAISDISIPPLPQTTRHFTTHNGKNLITSALGSSRTVTINHTAELQDSKDKNNHYHSALSTSYASDRSHLEKGMYSKFQWMSEYDDLVFRHPRIAKKRSRKTQTAKSNPSNKLYTGYSPSLLGTSADARQKPLTWRASEGITDFANDKERPDPPFPKSRFGEKASMGSVSNDKATRPRVEKKTRHISFGPRGFSSKAIASTEITTRHGEGSLLSRGLKSGTSTPPIESLSTTTQSKPVVQAPQDSNLRALEASLSSESDPQQSKPIPIRKSTVVRVATEASSKSKPYEIDLHSFAAGSQLHGRLAALRDLRENEEEEANVDTGDAENVLPAPVVLSPSTTLAPWLAILNPSNPSKMKKALAIRLGRWQHVFPKPLKTSQMKWKSLCSPAAVPLTTEDFPSAEQLVEEYEVSTYEVEIPSDSELSENPRSIITEILAFRISRGFQVVVGARLAESTGIQSLNSLNVFEEHLLRDLGATIFLSRGSMLHQMTRVSLNRIEVRQLARYSTRDSKGFNGNVPYNPFIRSMLAQDYERQDIAIGSYRCHFNWKIIDDFIAGHERPQAQDFVGSLRPWCARYVLIPVEASSSSWRRYRSNEDDEEEVRLEGIRKLTQIWQRFRYVPPEERQYQVPLRTRKDTNPLDIMYQTRNPSAIVAAELENVAEGDATARAVQLLPESDLYQRSNFTVTGLAETIQGEKGVRMVDRRWHLRLHYNCFIGFELTTWLLQNFRDVDTRDEAVNLGNELMKRGMFKHVEQRHNFRDGNYFYQIADEYRTPRPESRGWFNRSKASVPSTPMSEEMLKHMPPSGRSRSSSNSKSAGDGSRTPTERRKQQLNVALSKSLIFDVDHRKRSYRPELINLHYDRLHNPDNCYHIRIEWMNTTSKLIQDAIVSWATTADRFGLRLVEVPIGEASSITSMHPFRAPYKVKLAQRPPEIQPQSYFDNTSFAPRPKAEKNFYQKAIMKRFNFVLDFEAAGDYPTDVDVTYSWGKPDYHFSQYIHRSGMLLAQINDDGDFLLLANRLYSNRSATGPALPATSKADRPNQESQHRGPVFLRSSPNRSSKSPARPSPHESPYNSPSVHATLDIPLPKQSGRGLTLLSSVPKTVDPTRPIPTVSYTTPEAITNDFEVFCSNAEALCLFYDEVLSRASTPGPNTPFMGSKTPSKIPETGSDEKSIPMLALPGSVVEKSPAKKEMGMK